MRLQNFFTNINYSNSLKYTHDHFFLYLKLQLSYLVQNEFSISLEGYHELCQVDRLLPRAHVVQNFANMLDRHWDVKRTPGQAQGAELLFRLLLENEMSG